MLRLNKITIENFGPYYGSNSVELMDQNGVTFIWGLNGVGKTSLLNAIRFGLWGSLSNSKYASRPLWRFVNRNARRENLSMMVRLDCDFDGKKCVIIRQYSKVGTGDGMSSDQYEYSYSVKIGNSALSQEDAKRFLEVSFPEKISRFYLFDAELLQQYEKLVEENNDNQELKLAIERILGLPILEGAATSLQDIEGRLDKDYDRESKADRANNKKLKTYEAQKARRDQLISEIKELTDLLASKHEERQNLEDTLKENEQFRLLSEQENHILSKIESQSILVQDAKDRYSSSLEYLWMIFLDETIDSLLAEKTAELGKLQNSESKETDLLRELVSILYSKDETSCPICTNELTKERLSILKSDLEKASSNGDTAKRITALTHDISELSSLKQNRQFTEIIESLTSLIKADDCLKSLQIELEEIREKKKSYHTTVSSAEILKIAQDYSSVAIVIEEYEKGIRNNNAELKDVKADIDRLKAEISKHASAALHAVEKKQEFVESLKSIFLEGIDVFRDELKERVESTASEIFKSIAHNKEYCGLKINDNYGLEILATEDEEAPNRSEGYEQVVAISLLASLHRHAPIAGPIVMDSTFQRIDALHKTATLANLPNFGQQIIVLAYPTEVNRQEALNLLGTSYLNDLFLVQKSIFETKISDTEE